MNPIYHIGCELMFVSVMIRCELMFSSRTLVSAEELHISPTMRRIFKIIRLSFTSMVKILIFSC